MPAFDQKQEEFLRGTHFGKLATVGRSGSPQLTPIWYMLEGGKIIVNTTTDRVKFRNVRRNEKVAFLVDNGYEYVTIQGTARVANERDPRKDIEALAIRYTGEERGKKSARERFWKMDRVTLEITPVRVFADVG